MTPRLFAAAARPRALAALAAVVVVFGLAMVPAIVTMADHGASVIEWESAGSVDRMREILNEWGEAGERAGWWQLALDIPFVLGFGLFFAGACTAVAGRARDTGRSRLQRIATLGAWLGPVAAVADLLQDVSLALVLGGHIAQPWPRIAALTGPFITACIAIAAVVALVGMLLTRSGNASRPLNRGAVR